MGLLMKRLSYSFFAAALLAGALAVPSALAAEADATGLVPTVWWDFETQPDAAGLATANKGSASITFTSEGTTAYAAGAMDGRAINTASFTPYSGEGSFSAAGQEVTVSAVMTLGTNPNGITLNVRSTAGDLIVRRGADAGSLVVGFGPQKAVSSLFLDATFADGDAAYHLVSIVAGSTGTELYVDGVLADSTTETTLWSASGYLSQMQFGSHLNGARDGEAKFGGNIDDLRIHSAALTTSQMSAIAAEYGLSVGRVISVRATGEPTVGTSSFSTAWTLFLDEDSTAEAGLVYGTDAALSSPTTNALGSALAAGSRTASLTGLSPDTAYWWKIVASNGVDWAETPVASFRTHALLAQTDFAWRSEITLAGYAGASTLTNFPVLVKLAAGSPTGFDYADCAADGSDLRFAAVDGEVLPHEIESWNTNGTSFVWVRVPRLSGTDTRLTLCYGADPAGLPVVVPTDVWSRYAAVFHGGSTIVDATGNAANIKLNGVSGSASGGKAGGAMAKGSAIGIQFSNPATSGALASASRVSVSGWFKRSNSGSTAIVAANKNAWSDKGFLGIVEGGSYFSVAVDGTHQGTSGKGALVQGEWGHLAFAYDGTDVASFFNGASIFEKSDAKALGDKGDSYWAFGSYNAKNNDCFQGAMDELRVFDGVASADWFKAEYDSVADPAAFAVAGAVESTDETLPRFGAFAASDENGTATFSVALAVPGFGGEVPTAVSVFYGTNGVTWTELSLGSTNEAATLTGSASGFAGNARVFWYATATATQGDTTKTATSAQRSFVTKALDPEGHYKSFTATVDWDGAPAENIPVALRLSESAILGFSYADVTASGLEILDANGHLLPYEIDTWNTNGESLVWVLLPDYRDGAAFTVRYGTAFANDSPAATNVWANYVAVWHMNEILEDPNTSLHYTPDSSASGWHAYKAAEADAVPESVTTAAGATAHPAPLTGTAMNIGYGTGKSNDDLGGFVVPASATSSTTLNGPGFTLSAIVNAHHKATDGRCRVIALGNNYNEMANLAVGYDNIYCMGSNEHHKSNPGGATNWVCVTAVYGSSSFLYADGTNLSGSGGNPNLPSLALDKGIGLGCFTDGKQCLNGYLDEARIRNASSTTAYIAAEHHAMADDDALALSAVSSSDTSAPVLGVPTVARNQDGSFTVSVLVSENLPDTIFCTIDGTDYTMTIANAAVPATYSATVSDLPAGTRTASVRATSASGTTVSAACRDAFHAGALVVTVLANADEGTLTPGTFRVSRADATPTGLPALPFNVAFSGDGLAAVVPPGIESATIPAGESYVDITITPVLAPEVKTDTTVALAVSGAFVGQPSGATMKILNAAYDPAVRYVSTTGNDENHGGTPDLPKKTIGAAVASLANVAATRPGVVHVAPGLYPNPSPVEITKAIRVLGDDPDPSRTVVSNIGTTGYYGSHNQRLFTLNHADALVANLTMQKGIAYYSVSGGDFVIGSAGGTVSNCVVEAGDANSNGNAGGGYMEGGVVTHTLFRKNTCDSGTASWSGIRAGVLHMQGSARAENCLFTDNPQRRNVALITLGGKSVMRNCSIVDTGLSLTNAECKVWSALKIDSGATALNVVIAGVTNKVDGAPCPPTGTVANFLNGAFDGDTTGLPEGTASGSIDEFFPRHAESDVPDIRYRPESGSPLYDAGAEYSPMAALDLSGRQPRLVGTAVDIGCYEDAYLSIEATGEPTIGLESFATDFVLGSFLPADVSLVWSADASFADASTNTVAEGVTNGVHEASIGDLEPDTLYWWKLVADNGIQAIETAPAPLRTLGAPILGAVTETVSGPTVKFSVGLAAVARDELGNGLRTYISVYYTTNGTDYVEKPLGYAAWAGTLVGSATLPNGDCAWYARAYADYGGRTLESRTGLRTFRVFHNETPPAGFHRLDATIAYEGEPAEDIPVLLRLSESIEGFRYADVANNGKDFLFSDQDGNLLPFEIDTWNPAGESLVWVRVPVFADGTVIHLDYGASETDGTADAADVWRRYVGVWHLGATNAASAYGSYPNSTATAGIDGEKAKASVAGQAGRFGRSVKICNAMRQGAGYRLGGVFVPDAGENSPLDLGSTFMVSGWFKHEDQDYYYDKLFAKRNATNNEGSPSGAFSIEMGASSDSRVTVAGNGGNTGAGTLASSLRNAWSHLAFVFDGRTCIIYQDGAPCKTNTINSASDNDAPLCFGNTTGGYGDGTGGAAWCGWMDEVRLADGVPTAAWLAAEHAAMAPGTNVVRFAAVRDLQMPVLDGAPELAWNVSSFRYAATVAYGLGDVLLTTVDLYDGSATTNATHSFDSQEQLPQSFSDDVVLGENRMYRAVAVLRSSDGTEEDLAAADRMVYSGQLTATWIQDANIASMAPAIVRLSRAETAAAICADLTVSVELSGEAVDKGLLESVVSATIPAGTNCVDVAIRPIARSVVPGDYTATLAVTGSNVANPDGTRVEFGVLNAGADPYVRFVAPNGSDENDGALATSPKRTIAGALASFSDSARSALCTVHVAPGFYPISAAIVLSTPVRILGDDPDPSRVIVSNTVGAGDKHGIQRVFTINHADALVANLTMQKGSVWGDYSGGGNFLVDTAGGTVSNCCVEAGRIEWGGHNGAGGARLESGLVTHTVFRRNYTVTGSSPHGDGAYRAGVLMLGGNARAENCLIVDNPQSAAVTLVRLDGSASMRNCTIVDSPLAATNDVCKVFSALQIKSSAATVQNVVIAGVTNKLDGAPCLPTGHVSRFRNGAVDGAVEGRGFPAETVVGTSASFFRDRARGDYRPRSGGPLIGAGVNYEPMAGADLTGVQPRKVGSRVDIGCYEGFAETTLLILR
jgi:hypothetical protein